MLEKTDRQHIAAGDRQRPRRRHGSRIATLLLLGTFGAFRGAAAQDLTQSYPAAYF
jgi:hypothetical protein